MSATVSAFRESRFYKRFQANRRTRVRLQAVDEIDGSPVGRDLSAAKWVLVFRIYTPPAKATGQTFHVNEQMTKLVGTSAAGDTGKAEVFFTLPAAAVGDVVCEFVAYETDVADGTTPSGKRETVIEAPWEAEVFASSGAA